MNMTTLRRRREGGFTMIEMIIVVALIGMMAVFAAAYLRSIFKREKLKSVVKEIYSIVLATRMQAVRRNLPCVMRIDPANRLVTVWADALPNNYIQDAGEPTLLSFIIPDNVYFQFAPSGVLNDSAAVSFDSYLGNAALVDLIVFKGDGSLDPPQAPSDNRPLRAGTVTAMVPVGSINCNPANHCRGIFISDSTATGDVANRNTFRISVDDFGSSGRASLLKWVPTPAGGNGGEINYAPIPFRWVD
jgi:prepilin-type N-terminal cleavage/methylation domain-containing protein